MRIILGCPIGTEIGASGQIQVEMTRPGMPALHDSRNFLIVAMPPARPSNRNTSLPDFQIIPVAGPQSDVWLQLGWPENVEIVASSADMSNGRLLIYYSQVFPRYASQRMLFERRDTVLADSFTKRYEIWLAIHSLLLYQDQQNGVTSPEGPQSGENDTMDELKERQERCRIAMLSVLVSNREIQIQGSEDISD